MVPTPSTSLTGVDRGKGAALRQNGQGTGVECSSAKVKIIEMEQIRTVSRFTSEITDRATMPVWLSQENFKRSDEHFLLIRR